MTTDIQASQELITRALQADRESECNLLLDSARRLNPDVNIQAYKVRWLDHWLAQNENRKGANYEQ